MFWLLRNVCFIAAFMIFADAALPERVGILRVAAHYEKHRISTGKRHVETTEYEVDLTGEHPTTCQLEKATYDALRTGDAVELHRSRVFAMCVEIDHDGEVLQRGQDWRLWELFCAGFMVFFGLFFTLLNMREAPRQPD